MCCIPQPWSKGRCRTKLSRALLGGVLCKGVGWGTQSGYDSSASAPSWWEVVWGYRAFYDLETWENQKASTEGCKCVLKVEETFIDKVQVLGSEQVYKDKRALEDTSVLRLWWGSLSVTKYCASRKGESHSKDVHRRRPGGFLSGHAVFITLCNSSPAFFSSHQAFHFILTVHLLLT